MASFTNCFQDQKSDPSELPVGTDRLSSHKALIERYLAGLFFSDDPRLARLVGAMRYSLLVGGERLRPVLCMEVARSFGLAPARVLPSAAAVELVHTLSLIHGDLPALANDHKRIMPACHEKFGEATAILAGDGFFGESLALITGRQQGTLGQILMVVRELAGSTGVDGMIGEQMLRMNRARRAADVEALSMVCEQKTGSLIEASARIGAILAGATPEERGEISGYARHLGLCFRITNDVPNTPKVRRLADEALERALEALEGVPRDTAGLAELARFVRGGGS